MRRMLCAFAAAVALAAPAFAASVAGHEIHSTVTGEGPATIVFVHGWTCDETSWAGQVPAFADKYRVITLDLPGHGQSGRPAQEDFSMQLFADAVEAVRAEASADRIVLVGHSMGAPVIRQYALEHPERVAGLVAVDGPLDMRGIGGFTPPAVTGPDGLATREAFIRTMFVEGTSQEVRDDVLSVMLAAPEATAAGAMASMFDPSLQTADVIGAPVLNVVAGNGRMPDAASAEIAPDQQTVQMDGTGHFLMMEQPAEFNALLADFLETRARF